MPAIQAITAMTRSALAHSYTEDRLGRHRRGPTTQGASVVSGSWRDGRAASID